MSKSLADADHLLRNSIQDMKQVLTTKCIDCECQVQLLAWVKNIEAGYNIISGKTARDELVKAE